MLRYHSPQLKEAVWDYYFSQLGPFLRVQHATVRQCLTRILCSARQPDAGANVREVRVLLAIDRCGRLAIWAQDIAGDRHTVPLRGVVGS